MKVVLPLAFKYRQDIFDSVTTILLKEDRLNYSRLYSGVKQVLRRSLSNRDFSAHLEKMLKENTLHKEDPGKRGTPVVYSLTENAKRKYQLKILGIDEKSEKRRILYQLLSLFELFGSEYNITDEELDEFLSYIPASRKDLEIDTIADPEIYGVPILTCYKPVMGVDIMCVSFKESKYHKAETVYNIKLPGVSIRDFINPNSNRHLSFPLPFDHVNFTQEEVEDGIDGLQKVNLIRPIMYINGETRYSLVNNQLRDLLDKLYYLHGRKLTLMQSKCRYEKPTDDERNQIEFIYGKRKANKIINECYLERQARKKNREHFIRVPEERTRYESEMNKINKYILKLKDKYCNTLSDYGFNEDFFKNLPFERILQ